MVWRALALGVLCAVTLAPVALEAQGASAPALHWVRQSGAEACIAPGELAGAVEARLGRPVFEAASRAAIALEGSVAPWPDHGFGVTLRVSDETGEVLGSRELQSADPDCRALDEALVLIIAVTLYPESGLAGAGIALPPAIQDRLDQAMAELDQAIAHGTTTAPKTPLAATPAGAQGDPSSGGQADLSEADEETPDAQGESTHWSLGAGAGVAAGATPDITWMVGLRGDVQWGRLPRFELRLELLGPSQTGVADVMTDASVRTWGIQGALGVCTRRDRAQSLRAQLCGGMEAGALSAEGEGFNQSQSQFSALVAPYASLGLELALGGNFSLFASAILAVPLTRPQLEYQDASGNSVVIFTTSSATARGLAGALVTFP